MRTITAMFDSRAEAETARSRLAGAGISEDQVSIHDAQSTGTQRQTTSAGHSGSGDDLADGRDGTHRNLVGDYVDNRTGEHLMESAGSDRNLLGDYVDTVDRPGTVEHDNRDHDHHGEGLWSRIKGFFSRDDHVYEEGLRRGGHVLTARVDDADVDRATDILDTEGSVDIDARVASWQGDGWSGAAGPSASGRARVRSYAWDDQVG